MTVEKMLWGVWRNVTSATTGWSLGGSGSSKGGNLSSSNSSSSKSGERTRYSRLKSGGGGGRPTKSISQPANLTSLCSATIYSSSESLEGTPPDDNIPSLSLGLEKSKDLTISSGGATALNSSSGVTPKGSNGRKGAGSSMKHSISSFFPFTSCTSTNTSTYHYHPPPSTNDKTSQACRDSPPEKSSSTMMVPSSSSSSGFGMESPNNGVAPFSNICNGASATASGNAGGRGNPKNKISLRESSSTAIQMEDDNDGGENGKGETDSHWESRKDRKEVQSQNQHQDIICEDDISDLDEDVEHLTCDVCDRAFPTLKQLAAHQRKKRHYGCLQCDSIFPSREVLEYHREQMSHYDYVIDVYEEGEGDTDFFESEDDEHGLREDEDCDDEERERLL